MLLRFSSATLSSNAGCSAATGCRGSERHNRLEPGSRLRIACPERRTQRGAEENQGSLAHWPLRPHCQRSRPADYFSTFRGHRNHPGEVPDHYLARPNVADIGDGLAAIDCLSSMWAVAAGKETVLSRLSRPQIDRRFDLKLKATKQHPLV